MITLEDFLVKPKIEASLDPNFRPASLANRNFQTAVQNSNKAVPVAFVVERENGLRSRYDTLIFPQENDPVANSFYLERLVKAAVWNWGGHKIIFGGPKELGFALQHAYFKEGARAFDADLMGDDVYNKEFTVDITEFENVPQAKESAKPLGGHLEGNRVGFDLGASDRKSAALVDGKVVWSKEIKWNPKNAADPQYHIDGVKESIQLAVDQLPGKRVDAIGGSAAGIYIDNEPRVASLYRTVQKAGRLDELKNIFTDIGAYHGCPIVVVNDGPVTALAGRMALLEKDGSVSGVLGLAMGSSVAGGVLTPSGEITTRLDEFAFIPVDYCLGAPKEEWSEDYGVAANYMSQQAVDRLIPKAGFSEDDIDPELGVPEKLVKVQEFMANGDERAAQIYQTIGTYYGYSLPHYFDFYGDISHVLILGRVTTEKGGDIILDTAKSVLAAEFPEIYDKIKFHTPTEKEKRHGQAIAAASLPYVK